MWFIFVFNSFFNLRQTAKLLKDIRLCHHQICNLGILTLVSEISLSRGHLKLGETKRRGRRWEESERRRRRKERERERGGGRREEGEERNPLRLLEFPLSD